jgi:hypothetical protein
VIPRAAAALLVASIACGPAEIGGDSTSTLGGGGSDIPAIDAGTDADARPAPPPPPPPAVHDAGLPDSGAPDAGAPPDPSFCVPPSAAALHQQLFAPSCALSLCHDAHTRSAGLDLSSVAATCLALRAHSCEFPSRMRADPAAPAASLLVQKLSCNGPSCVPTLGVSDPSCTTGDARMPLDGAPIPACQLQALVAWIAGGLSGCP